MYEVILKLTGYTQGSVRGKKMWYEHWEVTAMSRHHACIGRIDVRQKRDILLVGCLINWLQKTENRGVLRKWTENL